MFGLIPFITAFSLVFNIQYQDPATKRIGLGACTAVYISPTEALTAAHCVEETTGHMWVRNVYNQAFTAKVIKKDAKIDLCLLQLVNSPHYRYALLGKPPKVNDKVYLVANDDRMPFTYGEGYVKNVLIDNDTHVLMIVHSASILPGASGSGLFNSQGQLIGINVMGYKGISYAIDITVIEGFLGKRGLRQ